MVFFFFFAFILAAPTAWAQDDGQLTGSQFPEYQCVPPKPPWWSRVSPTIRGGTDSIELQLSWTPLDSQNAESSWYSYTRVITNLVAQLRGKHETLRLLRMRASWGLVDGGKLIQLYGEINVLAEELGLIRHIYRGMDDFIDCTMQFHQEYMEQLNGPIGGGMGMGMPGFFSPSEREQPTVSPPGGLPGFNKEEER